MKAFFGFAIVLFLFFESNARTFYITTPLGKTIGKFNMREVNYEVSLNFFEDFPKGIRYGVFVHGKGNCRAYDSTLSSILLVNPESGEKKSGYDPKEYFIIPGSVPLNSLRNGSVRYHPGFNLETDLAGRVITLQEVAAENKPSGRIFNCWVY